MTFAVAAEAYGRFMGRYAAPLASHLVQRVGVEPGQRALDVGSGPGALTAELVRVLGPGSVVAVDPSPTFAEALRARLPGVRTALAVAEQLPFPDGSFDVTLAQLVVQFMTDPVRGLTEMRRVTRSGGKVAACVWDHAGGGSPLSLFWRAVADLGSTAPGEAERPGTREGQLGELLGAAGLREVESFSLTVSVPFASADAWWEPFTLGVGPAGDHVSGLDAEDRKVLRARCLELLPAAPFTVSATAWGALGRA